MKYLFLFVILISQCFANEFINLSSYTKADFAKKKDIEKLSAFFLDIPYKSNTLIGSSSIKEKLYIDFTALDCFTFIDNVQALKYANNFDEFKSNLIDTRYKNKNVSYENRKHFFSDWVSFNKKIKDITCLLGKCNKTIKYLNKKENNQKYLKNIKIVKRDIYYLKPKQINTSKLKAGDYIGIYTKIKGLDVTHTGIIIRKNNLIYLRHASSKNKKVLDVLFNKYIASKDGVIIYRNKKD